MMFRCPWCNTTLLPQGEYYMCGFCGLRYRYTLTTNTSSNTEPINDDPPMHPNCKVSQSWSGVDPDFSLGVDDESFLRWFEGLCRAGKKPQRKEPVPVPQPFYDAFKDEKEWRL